MDAASAGEGRGATFSVMLPRTASVRADPALPDAGAPALPDMVALDGIRVLVVDDEPDARDLFSSVLAGRGAVVRNAGSVREALEILESWRPDVLLSDLMMPGQDGHALLREVRARTRADDGCMPAIALTAASTVAERSRALAAGFHMYILKPVDPGDLFAAVARLAGRTSPA